MNDERVVHVFAKNRREQVHARLRTYRGVDLVDLRVFVEDETGAAQPTPKGLAVRVELLPQLRAAVDALIAEHEGRQAA